MKGILAKIPSEEFKSSRVVKHHHEIPSEVIQAFGAFS
jgi:hypothetical protein